MLKSVKLDEAVISQLRERFPELSINLAVKSLLGGSTGGSSESSGSKVVEPINQEVVARFEAMEARLTALETLQQQVVVATTALPPAIEEVLPPTTTSIPPVTEEVPPAALNPENVQSLIQTEVVEEEVVVGGTLVLPEVTGRVTVREVVVETTKKKHFPTKANTNNYRMVKAERIDRYITMPDGQEFKESSPFRIDYRHVDLPANWSIKTQLRKNSETVAFFTFIYTDPDATDEDAFDF